MKLNSDSDCPNCGHPMRLVHAVPKLGGLPALRSLRCYFCNEVATVAVAETHSDSARKDSGAYYSPVSNIGDIWSLEEGSDEGSIVLDIDEVGLDAILQQLV